MIFASSGNDSANHGGGPTGRAYPASCTSAFGVGAVDNRDEITNFSNANWSSTISSVQPKRRSNGARAGHSCRGSLLRQRTEQFFGLLMEQVFRVRRWWGWPPLLFRTILRFEGIRILRPELMIKRLRGSGRFRVRSSLRLGPNQRRPTPSRALRGMFWIILILPFPET